MATTTLAPGIIRIIANYTIDDHLEELKFQSKIGNLENVKWIIETFNVKIEHFKSTFYCVCSCGHLEIVKWLVDKFDIVPYHIRTKYNLSLKCACFNGHLEVAKWLVNKVNFADADIQYAINFTSCWSTSKNRREIIKWLEEISKKMISTNHLYG